MSQHKQAMSPELRQALINHGLETDTPSQLADCFRNGWKARAVKDAVGGDGGDMSEDQILDLVYEHNLGGATEQQAIELVGAVLRECCFNQPKPAAAPDVPQGAIHNGRAFADRLESEYEFECEAGPLSLCSDWQEFRRCFEHLAEWASLLAASQPEVKS